LTKFRSKQLKIWPGIHLCIDPIGDFCHFWFKSDQKWQKWKVLAFSEAKKFE
jgi:hypothetical protein